MAMMGVSLAQVQEVTNELEVALKAFTDNYRKLESDINVLVGSKFNGPAAQAFKASFEGKPTDVFNEVQKITNNLYQFMEEKTVATQGMLRNLDDIANSSR